MTEYALGEITTRVFTTQVETIAGVEIIPFDRIEAFGRALRWELELSGANVEEIAHARNLVRRVWGMCPELGSTTRRKVSAAFEHGFGLTVVPPEWTVH